MAQKIKRKKPSSGQVMDTPKASTGMPKYVVGIGASAGGLEALRLLFGAVKDAHGMTFVVVQHLAPQHRSRMVELVAHSTGLTVRELKDGTTPKTGIVYVTPPNKDVFSEKGVLHLRKPRLKIGPKPSIDLFFTSLAEDIGSRAIGIILSGTGSDGAQGVREIKAWGGTTLCQKVQSAKYDGMPKAAKQTGAIDFELTPEEIAFELSRFAGPGSHKKSPHGLKSDEDPYHAILATLESEVGASFAQYKQTTIRRRIDRRMVATRSDDIREYLELLRKTPEESKLLFQDVLISVTSFFRDPSSFKILEKELRERLRSKASGTQFRVWVVGCATGEEAYSIALLLFEAREKLKKNISIQIFASDLDAQALATARRGIYRKESLMDLSPDLLAKYFSVVEDQLQVKQVLRESVIFANHNVTDDPPFVNLDVVSCRNLLIYFNGKLQDQVFSTIHYALNRGGLLFLGKSETTPASTTFFEPIDKQAKIYLRGQSLGRLPGGFGRTDHHREAKVIEKNAELLLTPDLFDSIIVAFAPDSVLVDDEFRVKHLYGQASHFLNLGAGEMTSSISKLVPAELGFELVGLFHRAQKNGQRVLGGQHEIRDGSELVLIQLSVTPIRDRERGSYLVAFETRAREPLAKAVNRKRGSPISADQKLKKLEQELKSTREHLQTLMEEQETSREELQSLNEELHSANEELQSSNEELETANEELQSTNEELTTLNQEMNVKSSELISLNQMLQAVQNAIIYPLVVLDRGLKLVNFNPAARHLFRVSEQNIGTHIKALPTKVNLAELVTELERAYELRDDTAMQFKTTDRSFEVQIQLLRGPKDIVEGTVVSFVDNTEIMRSFTETKMIKHRLTDILDNTPAMVTMKDASGVVLYANRRFCELVDIQHDELIGQTSEEIFGAETGGQIRERDFEVIKQRSALQFEEKIQIKGKTYWFASSKFPLLDAKRRVQSVCTVSLDITHRVLHEQQLQLFKKAVSSSTLGIVIFGSDGQNYRANFASGELLERIALDSEALSGLNLEQVLKKILINQKPVALQKLAEQIRLDPVAAFTLPAPPVLEGDAWIELRSCPLKLDEDEYSHLILTIFDVTQRVNDQKTISSQQEDLTRFSRYSALGEIAAGIAHEINTPLNVVTTKTDFLRKLAELGKLDNQKAIRIASDVDQMAKNISSIVIGLKSLVGTDESKCENISIKQLISDTVKVCEFRLQRFGVELRLQLPTQDVSIECSPVQISQILINLINNSIEAISRFEKDRWIGICLLDGAETVKILVSDCGNGIDPSLAEKVMTPFFTTKKDQHGTGIGLSLSRTIAARHGGDLALDLNSKNTTFRLELPKKQA